MDKKYAHMRRLPLAKLGLGFAWILEQMIMFLTKVGKFQGSRMHCDGFGPEWNELSNSSLKFIKKRKIDNQ